MSVTIAAASAAMSPPLRLVLATCSREYFVKKLWTELRDAAGIPSGKRYGWHSFRRAFANALRDVPLRELKDLGGWKSERTVVAVYLRPDEQAQRTALARLAGNGQ
jgi:integrase